MKIAVYAISKNEEGFVERFCQSAADADYIVIADTGSDDDTVRLAEEQGASVYRICIAPWRFDHARNAALALVPADADICIALDLDEVMMPGWRDEIEKTWTADATRMRYQFDWSLGVRYQANKVHKRQGYHWRHPCHEVLEPDRRMQEVFCVSDMTLITHLPDPTKPRGQYLDLLRLARAEDPACTRTAFYLAREFTYHAQWDEAVEALQEYLAMPETWVLERCWAMRLLGKAYHVQGKDEDARQWYIRAVGEAAWSREPWADLAAFAYDLKDWNTCYFAAKSGLAVARRTNTYIDRPEVWGHRLYDTAALGAYHIGLYDEAVSLGMQACEMSPDDDRLASNLAFYREKSPSLSA
ncbi:hypothetical protein SZ64_10005 [Erythrobacter sp. SG61-1L]|uniref:tetratricopeptide repeat-containing glycosyltransferase n=1 Tax=Erythrobacter sp. SG61-1L TaxID=1603897 RepID=UPI0006C90CB6|nr:glycosyltransferase [Erythrobacter sp. SG61-1L]KPL68423.1 hypothetical protein SZ64_10005 [Erythrobacter sp. SG61-1L]